MTFWSKFQEAIEWLSEGIAKMLQWAGSEKTEETVGNIIRLVITIAELVDKFNAPLTGEEKAKFTRLLVRMLKYSSEAEIEELTYQMRLVKAHCELENIQSYELDMIIPPAIGAYLAQRGQDKMEDDGFDY